MQIAISLLMLLSVLLNLYAFERHRRARRRLHGFDADFARLLAFVAFLSDERSGAPENVRQLARSALPRDVKIDAGVIAPPSGRVH
jgi:hypothetical protein